MGPSRQCLETNQFLRLRIKLGLVVHFNLAAIERGAQLRFEIRSLTHRVAEFFVVELEPILASPLRRVHGAIRFLHEFNRLKGAIRK